MTRQSINLGSYDNDGTGDPLRTAFTKIEDNFVDIYGLHNDLSNTVSDIVSGGEYISPAELAANLVSYSETDNTIFTFANAVYELANTANNRHDDETPSYILANAAFSAANIAVPAFNKANAAYDLANGAYNFANTVNSFPTFRSLTTINAGNTFYANVDQEVILCDPLTLDDTIFVYLPNTATPGKVYTVKNINTGSHTVYVRSVDASSTIENGDGLLYNSVEVITTGAVKTWVYDGVVYRRIG